MNQGLARLREWISRHTLSAVLILGLIQGLVYVFAIPAWWHYDEPGHFEFAWQIAHLNHWPQAGEFDESMRRQMAASMVKSDFYKTTNYRPDFSSPQPVYVGAAPQTSNQPLYYILVSLPLRLIGNADFTLQNYVARLVSLLLFLLTLYCAWKALGELLPPGHPLQWMTVIFMALLPGFADTMTAVNDDVGAVLAFTVFVWAGIRLIKQGPSLVRLVLLIASLALCYWMKTLAWPAIPIAAVVVLFSIFHKRWRWVPWAVTGAFLVVGLALLIRWGDPADWYIFVPQDVPARTQAPAAPLGAETIQIRAVNGNLSYLGQWFNPSQIRPLRNKTVTIGAWMWSDMPAEANTPVLLMGTDSGERTSESKVVQLTTTPTFYSTTLVIPNDTAHMSLLLQPLQAPGSEVLYYYDGVTLALGDYGSGEPHYKDDSATRGTWNGQAFQNLVRNPSAQAGRYMFNLKLWGPYLYQVFAGRFPASWDVFIASVQDWQGTGWFYRSSFQTLFQTFWGRLARDKVGLLADPFSYSLLEVITALSLPGILGLLWVKRKQIPWSVLFFLGLSALVIWGMGIVRGAGTLNMQDPVYPWARYVFPAILPTALLLCAGWMAGLQWLGRILRVLDSLRLVGFPALMLGVDLFALISVAYYFWWHAGQEQLILFILLPITILLLLMLAARSGSGPMRSPESEEPKPAEDAPR